jgi:4-aminobutyrate aminotransferase
MNEHKSRDTRVPWIHTELPGPAARRMIEADQRVTSPSYTRVYPLAVASGEGAVLTDVDGNRFLDFTSGIAVCSTGHCHPRVVAAIQDQASRLLHMSGTDFYYAPQMELSRRLAEHAPGEGPKRVFLANSGAEAVEAAFKLARHHTGRQQVIAFRGAFHGRTMGALSLTASKSLQRHGFAPLVPGVHHLDYPYCFRCPRNSRGDRAEFADSSRCCQQPFEQLESLFRHVVSPSEVAAIIVEPVLGEGGYVVPPPDFLPQLREITREHGILLIADEVQSGMGRTGKLFAVEHWGVTPDILCLAKGIASGMPLGAMVAREDVMSWPSGAHASTFGGNPVACAAALATLDLLEESLIANAQRQGTLLLEQLRSLASRHAAIGDVRGLGLMVGVELVKPTHPHGNSELPHLAPSPPLADPQCQHSVIQRSFHKGLLLLGCGTSTVRFCPPLVIQAEQVTTAVQLFAESLEEYSSPE